MENRTLPLFLAFALPLLFLACVGMLHYLDLLEREGMGLGIGLGAFLVVLVSAAMLYLAVRRLEVSANRLASIIESVGDAIIATDNEGYIEAVNSSAVALFGYRTGEMVGARVTMLFPSNYRDIESEAPLVQFLEKNQLRADGEPREAWAMQRSGRAFPIDLSVAEGRLGQESVYTVLMRDISERVEARRKLQEAHDALEQRVRDRTAELEQTNGKLRTEITVRQKTQEEREALIAELRTALQKIKTLRGLLPICAKCKKIRDDKGYWSQIEVFIGQHSDAEFSHGICPDCARDLYPELYQDGEPGPI